MAVLRLSHPAGLILLLLGGCQSATRLSVPLPREQAVFHRPARVLLQADPLHARLADQLQRKLSRLPWQFVDGDEAELVLRVEPVTIRISRSVHHLHRYYDATATAVARLEQKDDERPIASAGARVHLSTRVRYSSETHVRDLLLTRLGDRLAERLAFLPRPLLIDLADPADGSMREGIERARRGDWFGALQTWQAQRAASRHPSAVATNIRAARRVLRRLRLTYH